MRFIDKAYIYAFSGKGGDGCSAMRHEKYNEFAGPDGGDGGRGGNVYIVGDATLSSLQTLRYAPHQKAGNGLPGEGKQKNGRAGKDCYIHVPLGTLIYDRETEELLFDIVTEEAQLLLQGGSKGIGNIHYKSSTNRAPRYYTEGGKGQEQSLILELKIIADVGLVGFPNAGKSTLIRSISASKAKVANYPFTTLVPQLGVVQNKDFSTFVVADIPGIIEGAHAGSGLGDQFLRHIQRTAVLAFVIDITSFATVEAAKAFDLLLRELELYDTNLPNKQRIILLNKIDSQDDEAIVAELKNKFQQRKEEVFVISAYTKQGTEEVKERLAEIVRQDKENKTT